MKQIFEIEWEEGEITGGLLNILLREYFGKMNLDAKRLKLSGFNSFPTAKEIKSND